MAGQTPIRGCSGCNSLSFSQEFYDAFNVVLCNQCKQDEQLISKSTARQSYLLTDTDLKKLGSIGKQNPHRKEWNAMRLYLQSQVEELSYTKYGGAEGLEVERERQLTARLDARMKKRTQAARKDNEEAEKLDRIKQKIVKGMRTSGAVSEEALDSGKGIYQRKYESGATAEVEHI
ncbi:hypothetical protein WJX72_001467 [[Myrmecia] bisecta]|uniref:XPA C-terminal domain-containing protein n=1 Tax=[Myrmecia] bisecta TaxID=41462 RepID=A0AAW1R4M6_9CHLO